MDKRKVGIPVDPRNKGDVVYQARMYKVNGRKFRVMDTVKMRSTNAMIKDFMEVYAGLEQEGFNQDKLRFCERLQYISLLGLSILRDPDSTSVHPYVTNNLLKINREMIKLS